MAAWSDIHRHWYTVLAHHLGPAQGRIKSLYSIQRKMRRKGVPLEEVYDARALRVVVDDEEGKQQASSLMPWLDSETSCHQAAYACNYNEHPHRLPGSHVTRCGSPTELC